MAFAAIGALVAGTATAIEVVAAIGTISAIVGGVTGNKELMKVGGVMSLAAGIGSMAMGAMGATEAAGAASLNATADAAGAVSLDAAADASAQALADAVGTADLAGATNLANPTVTGQLPDLTNPFSEASNITSLGNPNPGQMSVGAPAAEATVNDVAGVSGVADNTAVAGVTSPFDAPYPEAQSIRNAVAPEIKAPTSMGDFFKSISKFADDNKMATFGGLQLLGGAMSGANQREIADQNAALTQQRLAQTSYGSQVAAAPRGILSTGAR